jgi:hypothetical protein
MIVTTKVAIEINKSAFDRSEFNRLKGMINGDINGTYNVSLFKNTLLGDIIEKYPT